MDMRLTKAGIREIAGCAVTFRFGCRRFLLKSVTDMFYSVGQAVRRWSACVVCLVAAAPVFAQTAPVPDGKSPSSEPMKKPGPGKGADGSVTITGRDGKPVTVSSETMQRFLEWMKREGPDSAINSVTLEGTADETRARLTATLIVQVLRDEEWLRVPLYLNEAVVLGTKHEFLRDRVDGKPQKGGNAAFSDRTSDGGYRWWFRGRGYHRLTLSLVVSIKKSVAQRRLRLKLPPLSAASTLKLRVADANVNVVPQKGTDTRTRRVGKSSEITVAGLGGELDLEWKTLPRTPARSSVLETRTAIFVDFTVESVVLTAVQTVQPVGGGLQRVEVQLPTGFQAGTAKGDFVKGFRVDARNRATVEFTEARAEPTKITWTLSRALPTGDSKLVLDGFQVAGGRFQQGQIAVANVQGLRVTKTGTGDSVPQIRASRFSAPDLIRDKRLSGVYQFFKQPFRMNLAISRLRPHLTVQPTFHFEFRESRLKLTATYELQVSEDGAPVRKVEIHWPNRVKAGWDDRTFDESACGQGA